MPKTEEIPTGLRAYSFHGLDLGRPDGSGNATADCPFCGKEGKFAVHQETSQAQCWSCGEKVNSVSFLRKLHELSDEQTKDYDWLMKHRRLLNWETLDAWGVARSTLRNEWLLPGYDVGGSLNNLYRYSVYQGRGTLLSTPGCHHQLYGVKLYNRERPGVYLLEGPWDAMALWETLRQAKVTDDGLRVTANPDVSLLASINVLATPSATVFDPKWASLFAGKVVTLLYDSDHPKEHNGRVVPPSGYAGMRRVAEILAEADDPPASIRMIHWGQDGYDPEQKSGYDVRDYITQAGTIAGRVALLPDLLAKTGPIPDDWLAGRTREARRVGATTKKTESCSSWKELVNQWRKAMKWSEGLDRALSAMLASILSTQMVGDQLWIRVISPPSTGKTQLCDAVGTAKGYVRSVGNFTGLHSGFQTDKHGDEDHSLLSQLKDMTLVVKDGDTILKSAKREVILGQVRDAYDTNCAVAYGNRVKREYEAHRFTFILAGTEALLEMDSAELGARFLDVIIMTSIDPDLESEVNLRNVFRVLNNRGVLANGTPDSQDDPDTVKAKAMTGGYVEHLRRQSSSLLSQLNVDNAEDVAARINHYAQLVAYMRARPSKKQQEAVTREMSTRLVNQLSKLAVCLAVVLNKPGIDEEVLRRVRQTARDTARGSLLRIAEALYERGREGMPSSGLSLFTDDNEQQVKRYLRFMKATGSAERINVSAGPGLKPKQHWRLTSRMESLYRETIIGG